MAKILKPLCLTPKGGEIWELTSDFVVQLNDGTIITILAGYASDGQSGNKIITSLLTIYDSYQEEAAYPHDICYQAGIEKGWCDAMYMEILKARLTEDEAEKRYAAVHWFGEQAYTMDQADMLKKAAATQHLRISFPTA